MDLIPVKRTISIVLIILGCALLLVPFLLLSLGVVLGDPTGFVLLEVGGLLAVAIGYLFKVRIKRFQRGEVMVLLQHHLKDLKSRSYDDLKRLMVEPARVIARTDSGKIYTLKFEGFWKNIENGDIRVIGSLDPESGRVFQKDWVEFVVAQDDGLVEEDL